MDHDIIGDVHGQAHKLEALLEKLGYRERDGARRHPSRQAIFVGDFIDRGPHGVEVVDTVRRMVDAGSAIAVMGNHELNAMAWHTPDAEDPGEYLRPRLREPWGVKNRRQHAAFLAQVEDQPDLHREIVEWFMTLPLWLDLPELRIVHACWHAPALTWLAPRLREGRFLTPELLPEATKEPAQAQDEGAMSTFAAVELLTKGVEAPLPPGHSFKDRDGTERRSVRLRWWDTQASSYRDLALLPGGGAEHLPDLPVPAAFRSGRETAKPIFFGHYWMTGEPKPLAAAAACVDYSAGNGGPLVACRFEAGASLSAATFTSAG